MNRFAKTNLFCVGMTLLCASHDASARPCRGLTAANLIVPLQQRSASQSVDRYLQIVRRRPRPGTAFHRLYAAHQLDGTLDDLVSQLTSSDQPEAAQANDLQLAALIELRRGALANAAELFRTAEQKLPGDPGPPWGLGVALLRKGELAGAIASFDRALQLKPSRTEAIAIRLERGRSLLRSDRLAEADENWNQLLNVASGDRTIAGEIVSLLRDERHLPAAAALLRSLIERESAPEVQTEYKTLLAQVLVDLQQAEPALRVYEDLLANLKPGSSRYTAVFDQVHKVLQRVATVDERLTYYQRWFQSHPTDMRAGITLANAFADADQRDKAEATLSSLIQAFPDHPEPRRALVELLQRWDRIAEAIEQQVKLTEARPEDWRVRDTLGKLWLLRDDLPEADRRQRAAEAWRDARRLVVNNSAGISELADRFRQIESTDEALECYRQAIEWAPNDSTYREQLGAWFHEQGDRQRAFDEWQQIAAGDRRTADSLFELAAVLISFGYRPEAISAAQQAAVEFPSFRNHVRCAEFLDRHAQIDQAMQQLAAAHAFIDDGLERQQWNSLQQSLLEHAVRLAAQRSELPTAIQYQRQLLTLNDDAATRLALAKLLLRRAGRLERESELSAACDLQLEAMALAPASYAAELESYIQLFERAQQLTKLVDGLLSVPLASFQQNTNSLLRVAADIHRADPLDDRPQRLIRRLLSTFPDDAGRIRQLAAELRIPLTESTEGDRDGTQ
jgi:tetratricopeptide (TPR) repeat protein